MKKFIAIFAALCAFFYSGLVLAQSARSGGWVSGVSSTGQTVWFGPGYQTKSSAGMGKAIWASATGGAKVTTSADLVFGAAKAPAVLKGFASAAAMVTTAKLILGGPVGVGMTALMLVPAAVDWFTTDTTRPADPSAWATDKPFEQLTNQGCGVAPCYVYSHNGAPTVWYPSATSACTSAAAWFTSTSGSYSYALTGVSNYTCLWAISRKSDGSFYANSSYDLNRTTVPPEAPVWLPASIEEIRAKMEITPYVPGLVEGLLEVGGSLPIAYAPGDGWSGATGPASVSSVPVVKVTDDGTNTTTTTTTNKTDITYGSATSPTTGTTVPTATGTTYNTVTTTVINNSTQNTVSTTTTNEGAPAEEVKDDCETNPDSLKCSELDTPEGEIPKDTKTITYAAEDVFGTGSCPANLTANIATLGGTYTVWDWQKTCEYALPLRALIMALAAFAAFLIVMPVKVDV